MNIRSLWNHSRPAVVLSILVVGSSLVVGPSPVAASEARPQSRAIMPATTFTASNAVAYADLWVDHNVSCGGSCTQKRNPNYKSLSADCTNFVSQALAAGGFKQVSGGSTHWDAWWSSGTGGNSNTWSVAPMLLNFLWIHSPGGIVTAFWTPMVGAQATSGTKPGGLIFYDWGYLNPDHPNNGEGVSHVSMVVANGKDPYSGWTGDLVDQHVTDRYHAFWTLEPYNGANGSTTFTVVGTAAGN